MERDLLELFPEDAMPYRRKGRLRRANTDYSTSNAPVATDNINEPGHTTGGYAFLEKEAISVTEFLSSIEQLINDNLSRVIIRAEVYSSTVPRSGHCYFLLKDEKSQLKAVMFARRLAANGYIPKIGDEIVIVGSPNIYGPKGELQVIADIAMPCGRGAQERALRELVERLRREGLFDDERKLPIPQFPKRVFLITSPTGAAIKDFLRIAYEMVVLSEIIVCPVRVQGDGADSELIDMLDRIEEISSRDDTIVIMRGGGGKEDLSIYNSEALSRRIFRATTPIVSAVGHEIDITICDLVADLRVPTPTAAAQRLFFDHDFIKGKLEHFKQSLTRSMGNIISRARLQLQSASSRLKDPVNKIYEKRIRLDELSSLLDRSFNEIFNSHKRRLTLLDIRLKNNAHKAISINRHRLKLLSHTIDALSPLKILSRGYSVVKREDGHIVKDEKDCKKDDILFITPYRGKIKCVVL